MMFEGLQAILEKDPVVSTVNADDLINAPESVESGYAKHVATYIPMGDVSEFSERLTKRIISAKTPKGLVVAPYGYGKTSTSVFLWRECEKNGLVATPPFYCADLLDVLKATYGWVKYRIERSEPGLVDDLHGVYRKYTSATVDEMAKRYANEHGLAPVTARNMLNEMLEDGSLVLELTPANLLFFLDAAANIVSRAGFEGLAVLPDEFQQYFSKGANLRKTIQEFREFVWGLDTRSTSLGVIYSIPTYAESHVQEQGKDILHRLKKDGLYYRLEDIYTVSFPARLWERYVEAFNLDDIKDGVIDGATLRAIGQIAERKDLGEGPRTVVDSFKRAILHYQDHGRSYSPIDLIDDFLESNINFQAQTNRLKTVTRQALDSTVVDTSERTQAVKLLAAFPRGCPTELQKKYGLYDVVNSLSKQAHGELMTHLVEGYTLLGLSRTGGPTRTVDIIITRFWHSYEEDELHLEAAIRAFCNRLLDRFFEQRRGASATGWINLEFEPTAQGSYLTLIEGTFNPRFPRRRLALQVAYDDDQLQPLAPEADLQFDFLFDLDDLTEVGKLELQSERLARFELNLKQKVGPELPEDLRKLQDFVNPEFVTPLLMLSLVDYFDRWESIEEQPIPESDRAEVEYFIGRLIDHSVQILFNDELAGTVSPQLRRVGRFMLEELFNRFCLHLFENYHTLFIHAQYDKVLTDYINAMKGMTLKERRGVSPLRGTKDALARRFGLSRVSTFENRIDSEYANLIDKVEWTGRGDRSEAVIELTLHPLENEILQRLRASENQQQIDGQLVPVLSANEISDLARGFGYRDEETLLALQLLVARRYVRFDEANKRLYLAQVGPDRRELESQLEKLVADVEMVEELISSEESSSIKQRLADINDQLDKSEEDEEELDELQTQIGDLRQHLDDLLSAQRDKLRQQVSGMILDIERDLVGLKHNRTLERNIEGQVAFVMHLNEVRQRLIAQQQQLDESYSELKEHLNRSIVSVSGGPATEVQALHKLQTHGVKELNGLRQQRESLETQLAWLEEWLRLLRDTERLFNALALVPDLRKQLTQEVIPEIQAHLTKRGVEGLSDWEPFQTKVEVVEEELEKRRRHGNEVFAQAKEHYEQFLRQISVGDYRPRTRYTYGEDEDSYKDLYEEVRAKVEGRLNEIRQDLERERLDLLKAKHITIVPSENKSTIDKVENQLREAEDQLNELFRALNLQLIREADEELDAFGDQVNELAELTADMRQQLGPIIFADHDLAQKEGEILQTLGTQADVDLTDLFVRLHQGADDGIELSELLTLLETLYRKHRISIRVRARG